MNMEKRKSRLVISALVGSAIGLVVAMIGFVLIHLGYSSFGTGVVALGVIGGNLLLILGAIVRFVWRG